MNPDKQCNFDCVYCEVDRSRPARDLRLDVEVMIHELEETLETLRFDGTHDRGLPSGDSGRVRHVALSGDGEPTLSPVFESVVESVVSLRARGRLPFFKMVLITNASGLDRPDVRRGLEQFTMRDEIWAKLETGDQARMDLINRPTCTLEHVLANILALARLRPVIIQSLFPALGNQGPTPAELESLAGRLNELVAAGARIPLVQVYSATRVPAHPDCGHLSLRQLTEAARFLRGATRLPVEVY